jgi:hypothetical protein
MGALQTAEQQLEAAVERWADLEQQTASSTAPQTPVGGD